MSRTYQQRSASDLHALAEAEHDDPAVLLEILEELRLRKTQKAADVRQSVEALMAATFQKAAKTSKAPAKVPGKTTKPPGGGPARTTRASLKAQANTTTAPARTPTTAPAKAPVRVSSKAVTTGPNEGVGGGKAAASVPSGSTAASPWVLAPHGVSGDTGLLARYEALRETFTEEAEALARWGITPLLPPELRRILLEAWAERLRVEPAAHPYRLTAEDLVRDRRALGDAVPTRREEMG